VSEPTVLSVRDLSTLIKTGRLFSLQAALAGGDVETLTEREWENLAVHAVGTGFYSIVEVLLSSRPWNPASLARALDRSVSDRRYDITELLLGSNASVSRVYTGDLFRTMDLNLITRFLRLGVDPAEQNAFASVLNATRAKSLLGIYRSLREEFPVLDAQVSLALSEAVREKNLRWISLLRWAGADPFRPVPYDLDEKWRDNDLMTSAAERACWGDREEAFKLLKIQPTSEQALELLRHAAYDANIEVVRYLLRFVPKERVNETKRSSSAALEELVRQDHKDYGYERRTQKERQERTLECVRAMLDHGACWNPDDSDLRYARRGLGSHDGKYVVRIIRLLLYTEGACDPVRVWEFCRTGTMQSRIKIADGKLWDELQAVRSAATLMT